jgi:hypothetical protein
VREVEYDNNGLKQLVLVPDDAPADTYQYGILVGPPDLSKLDLPEAFRVRLSNELYYRKLFTRVDAKRRITDVVSSVISAARADAQKVLECYE